MVTLEHYYEFKTFSLKKNKFFWLFLILCGFHIMYPNPTYLPDPWLLPSALATYPPPNKTNFKRKTKLTKQNKITKKEKNLIMESVVWPTESHCLLFSSFIFTVP